MHNQFQLAQTSILLPPKRDSPLVAALVLDPSRFFPRTPTHHETRPTLYDDISTHRFHNFNSSSFLWLPPQERNGFFTSPRHTLICAIRELGQCSNVYLDFFYTFVGAIHITLSSMSLSSFNGHSPRSLVSSFYNRPCRSHCGSLQTNKPECRQEKFERGQRWSLLDNKFNVQDNQHPVPPAISLGNPERYRFDKPLKRTAEYAFK